MVEYEIKEDKARLFVTLSKDLTSNSVPTLEQSWQSFASANPDDRWKTVFFDLRETRLLDSVGLNWMFSFYRQINDAEKKLIVRVSSPAIKRVLDFACFENFAEVRFRRRRQTR